MKVKWYYQIMGDVFGPVDSKTMKDLAERNTINRDTFVRQEQYDWVTADRIEGLFARRPAPIVVAEDTNIRAVAGL